MAPAALPEGCCASLEFGKRMMPAITANRMVLVMDTLVVTPVSPECKKQPEPLPQHVCGFGQSSLGATLICLLTRA